MNLVFNLVFLFFIIAVIVHFLSVYLTWYWTNNEWKKKFISRIKELKAQKRSDAEIITLAEELSPLTLKSKKAQVNKILKKHHILIGNNRVQ